MPQHTSGYFLLSVLNADKLTRWTGISQTQSYYGFMRTTSFIETSNEEIDKSVCMLTSKMSKFI